MYFPLLHYRDTFGRRAVDRLISWIKDHSVSVIFSGEHGVSVVGLTASAQRALQRTLSGVRPIFDGARLRSDASLYFINVRMVGLDSPQVLLKRYAQHRHPYTLELLEGALPYIPYAGARKLYGHIDEPTRQALEAGGWRRCLDGCVIPPALAASGLDGHGRVVYQPFVDLHVPDFSRLYTTDVYFANASYSFAHREWVAANMYPDTRGCYYDTEAGRDGANNEYAGEDDYDDDSDYDDERSNSVIHPYHSYGSARRNAVRFHPPLATDELADDSLTLGMELEINSEDREHLAVTVQNVSSALSGRCIAEHDGSLSDEDGVEIITGWSTLHTVVGWAKAYADAVASAGGYNTADCGLHIATSPLPPQHIHRIMGFIYADANATFVRKIAGRGFNGYAGKPGAVADHYNNRLSPDQEKGSRIAQIKAAKARLGHGTNRYDAIHVRSSGDDYERTVEWRLFKGSGNFKRIAARLQFVWGLTKHADPNRCQPLTVPAFLMSLTHDPFIRRHTGILRDYIAEQMPDVLSREAPAFVGYVERERERATKKLVAANAAAVRAKQAARV